VGLAATLVSEDRKVKPGFILGLAIAVPAFFVIMIFAGEPMSALAALAAGIVLSAVSELSNPTRLKFAWARGTALVVWWVVLGFLVGEIVAVAAGLSGPPGLGGGVIGLVGQWVLGIWGPIVGYVIGRCESKGHSWRFILRTLLIVMTVIAVLLGMAMFFFY
jgi:hypothetical protein